jgi:hypothetical protein
VRHVSLGSSCRTLAVLMAALCLAMAGAVNSVSQESTFESGVDRPGFDYRNFSIPKPRAKLCEEACLADFPRCRAWTFVDAKVIGPLASCWLKQQAPEPKSNTCCDSGVLR